jgi:hypothetical protein
MLSNPHELGFGAARREPQGDAFSIPRRQNGLDGRSHSDFISGWIEELFLSALPSLAEEELAHVLATQSLLVKDPAIFIAD